MDIELVGAREKDAEDETGMKQDGSLWDIYRALLRCPCARHQTPKCSELISMAARACVLGMFMYANICKNRKLVSTLLLLLLLLTDPTGADTFG